MSPKNLFLLFLLATTTQIIAQVLPPLQYVKTVRQKGPVAYRDPFGAISPDGNKLAYSDRNQIFVQLIEGGATYELEKQGAFVITIDWLPDSQHLITYEIGGKKDFWYVYDLNKRNASPLWPESKNFTDRGITIDRSQLKELSWSNDKVVGTSRINGKSQLWLLDANGQNEKIITEKEFITSPQWNPADQVIAGIVEINGKRKIQLDLNSEKSELIDVDCYGTIAFSPDGKILFYSKANNRKVIDLHSYHLPSKKHQRLASFSRDSYDPSVSSSGSVLFKLQDYRVFIAATEGESKLSKPVTTFMSELSYWDPTGKELSFTYGNWRRVMDDMHYPDISQEIGYINFNQSLPAEKPDVVVRSSYSEDQGMCWSPNKKWVAFHTHADGTDDIWIQPNNDSTKGVPLSKGGSETGRPRWSPDGKWIVYTSQADGVKRIFTIGMSQETGKITTAQKVLVPNKKMQGAFADAHWLKDSETLVTEYVPDLQHKELYLLKRDGSVIKKIHTYTSDQQYSGISISHDYQWVAYIAPDNQGNYQVFKVSMDGKTVKQLTYDATDKTHPSFSPAEDIISYTVFSYQVIFWMLNP